MSNRSTISKIRSRYLTLRWVEVVAITAAVGLMLFGLLHSFHQPMPVTIGVPFVVAAIAGFVYYRYTGLSTVDDLKVSLFLNRQYPQVKESSDLLLKEPQQLSTLEQLQLQKIQKEVIDVAARVVLPHRVAPALVALVVALLVAFLLPMTLPDSTPAVSEQPTGTDVNIGNPVPADPRIKELSVTVQPPAYTGLAPSTTGQLSFHTVEGSRITWSVRFHQPVHRARIVFTTGDSLVASTSSDAIGLSTEVHVSMLYRLVWEVDGRQHSSDYSRIDVKPDQLPQVAIRELPQFTRIAWGEKEQVAVRSLVQDDYGLTSAHVVATVSKGSGESVKFREEKIPFSSPAVVSGKEVNGTLTLDFRKLGMDPGDEVYFYVEAFDNRKPVAQRNRTDTYFISLQDTARQEMVMDDGLGVDLMPDYFRSQRQLIIDTEKLLAEQKKITKQQFNSTSNELGYDQKVLRLRYGQFLGEEFETSIGETEVPEEEEHEHDEDKEEDILSKYGHQHDTENEHNLVADKKEKEEDHHDHHEHHDEDENDPMAAFRHNHDSEEEATFFTQSIKAKLRAALTLMWDAELKLRLYQPKESLPYQYQILKLLKEISQDSRIYVHRMGFDPPPIKEERRLTGALDEIKPGRAGVVPQPETKYPAIRLSLNDLSELTLREQIVLTGEQRARLEAAGNELASVALLTPGSHLKQLSNIRAIVEGRMESAELRSMLTDIQASFWQVLPNDAPTPARRSSGNHPLDVRLLKEINKNAND